MDHTGVRKIQLFADLVDDPLRFVRIALPNERSAAAFFQQMRVFAEENGFQFSQQPWETENRCLIVGNGFAITATSSSTGGAARAMLELHPRADGTLPTEAMMDQLLSRFAAAVERTGGTVLVVEPGSYLDE